MCGIAGIYSKDASLRHRKSIEMMTNKIAHRGPDGYGFYLDKDIAFGHRRLSIIDLTDAAQQPMTSQCNRFNLIYNGELYNYLELREELIKRGFAFKSNSDTEVVLILLQNQCFRF